MLVLRVIAKQNVNINNCLNKSFMINKKSSEGRGLSYQCHVGWKIKFSDARFVFTVKNKRKPRPTEGQTMDYKGMKEDSEGLKTANEYNTPC